MANTITETVKAFYVGELNKYGYSHRDIKEDAPTFWITPGSTLSKRIKASILFFARQGKNIAIVIPPEGNNIRMEIDSLNRDEKLFLTIEFNDTPDSALELSKEIKKELVKAGVMVS